MLALRGRIGTIDHFQIEVAMDTAKYMARSATEIGVFSATMMSLIYVLSRFVKLDPSDDSTAFIIAKIVVPLGFMASIYVAIVVSNFFATLLD
jgi:hypothetical protein